MRVAVNKKKTAATVATPIVDHSEERLNETVTAVRLVIIGHKKSPLDSSSIDRARTE